MIAGLKVLETFFSVAALLSIICFEIYHFNSFKLSPDLKTLNSAIYGLPVLCSLLDASQAFYLVRRSKIKVFSVQVSNSDLNLKTLVVIGLASYFQFLLYLATVFYSTYLVQTKYESYNFTGLSTFLKIVLGAKTAQSGFTVIYSALWVLWNPDLIVVPAKVSSFVANRYSSGILIKSENWIKSPSYNSSNRVSFRKVSFEDDDIGFSRRTAVLVRP